MKRKTPSINLDHAAATPIDPGVLLSMRSFFTIHQANPSALYKEATFVREKIDEARALVATILEAQPDTVLFTSGGTESCVMAILGVVREAKKNGVKKPHIVTTAIEHHAVLEAVRLAEKEGADVTIVPVTNEGIVRSVDVLEAISPQTVLVSVMYANNELGTIQPISDIGRGILRLRKSTSGMYPIFHTDACQAGQFLDLSVERLHVDLLTLNGSKIYGPKGIGVLYKRRGVPLYPLIPGGGQEFGLRSGTENVPNLIGFSQALQRVRKNLNKESARVEHLRDDLEKFLTKKISHIRINKPKDTKMQLPHFLHVTFFGAEAEALIVYLDAKGIAVASGSACATDKDEASHVLLAAGMSKEEAGQSIRFSLGQETTRDDMAYVKKVIDEVVSAVRKMGSVS